MRFDIKQYKGNYVMNCKTEEEAQIFLNYLSNIGLTWCTGDKYSSSNTHFSRYRQDTCYSFNDGTYCDLHYFQERNLWTILEFSNFIWDEIKELEITPNDAKSFDTFISQFTVN